MGRTYGHYLREGPVSKNDSGELEIPLLPNTVYRPPTCDMEPDEVEDLDFVYSDVPPNTFVISGPLTGGPGKGRRFDHVDDAEEWVNSFYGRHYGRIRETEDGGRWAFRVEPVKR